MRVSGRAQNHVGAMDELEAGRGSEEDGDVWVWGGFRVEKGVALRPSCLLTTRAKGLGPRTKADCRAHRLCSRSLRHHSGTREARG